MPGPHAERENKNICELNPPREEQTGKKKRKTSSPFAGVIITTFHPKKTAEDSNRKTSCYMPARSTEREVRKSSKNQ